MHLPPDATTLVSRFMVRRGDCDKRKKKRRFYFALRSHIRIFADDKVLLKP